VDDVKAHFQTAARVVATSTSQQMDQMRNQYKSEVGRMDDVLNQMEHFMASQKGTQTALQQRIGELREESLDSFHVLRKGFDDIDAKGKKQYMAMECETQQLRRGLKEVENAVASQDHSRALRNDLVAMLVESQLLSTALDWQDNQDRKSISLFGLKGEGADQGGGNKSKASPRLPGIGKTPRRGMDGGNKISDTGPDGGKSKANEDGVVQLDTRCLSCSGNANTVLAAFKLACLQYESSPVEYQKASYSREEVIRLQMDLLAQAREQLRAVE
jgi:hypothetical protein